MTASADSPLETPPAMPRSSAGSVALAAHVNAYADQAALLALNAEHAAIDSYDSSLALRAAKLRGYARTARLLAAQGAYSSPELISSAAAVNTALREFCRVEASETTQGPTVEPEC